MYDDDKTAHNANITTRLYTRRPPTRLHNNTTTRQHNNVTYDTTAKQRDNRDNTTT